MTTLLTLCLSLLLAAPAWALSLDYMTTIVEQTAQNVRWDLYFVGTPDVYTVDQYGRQADSFQLWIYETPRADIFNTSDRDGASVLIRGEEIHWGNGIPIRNTLLGADFLNDPHGGGWGSIRETDPIFQDGKRLSFTTSLSGLGISGLGPFGYGHETYEFGDSGRSFFGGCSSDQPCAAPIPDMLWPTLAGFVGLAGVVAWRRRMPHGVS